MWASVPEKRGYPVASCEWGNHICEVPVWEEGEDGALDGCGGWEAAEPRPPARKEPMKEEEELPTRPLPECDGIWIWDG